MQRIADTKKIESGDEDEARRIEDVCGEGKWKPLATLRAVAYGSASKAERNGRNTGLVPRFPFSGSILPLIAGGPVIHFILNNHQTI